MTSGILSGLGVVEGSAFVAAPLGGILHDAPHGALCAAVLPHGMTVNIRALRRRGLGCYSFFYCHGRGLRFTRSWVESDYRRFAAGAEIGIRKFLDSVYHLKRILKGTPGLYHLKKKWYAK